MRKKTESKLSANKYALSSGDTAFSREQTTKSTATANEHQYIQELEQVVKDKGAG